MHVFVELIFSCYLSFAAHLTSLKFSLPPYISLGFSCPHMFGVNRVPGLNISTIKSAHVSLTTTCWYHIPGFQLCKFYLTLRIVNGSKDYG